MKEMLPLLAGLAMLVPPPSVLMMPRVISNSSQQAGQAPSANGNLYKLY